MLAPRLQADDTAQPLQCVSRAPGGHAREARLVALHVVLSGMVALSIQGYCLHVKAVRKVVQVNDGGQPVYALNELEWIEGEVWANIWLTDCIARIDPASGSVKCGFLPYSQLTCWDCFDSAMQTKSFL